MTYASFLLDCRSSDTPAVATATGVSSATFPTNAYFAELIKSIVDLFIETFCHGCFCSAAGAKCAALSGVRRNDARSSQPSGSTGMIRTA
jgi:hypothetical protein